MSAAFRWYLGGVGSWFAGYGMAITLFPWLVAVVLQEPPQRLGIAQLALLGPSTAFLLFGGAVADRGDCRALLIRYHLLALVPPALLAVAIGAGRASYPVVLAYGIALGTLSAFVMPARDTLLTRIATAGHVPRAIAVATITQLVFQLGGIALVGAAGRVGAVPVLAMQAIILGAGALTATQLSPTAARQHGGGGRLAAMRDGVRVVARSREILPVVIAIGAVGLLFVGAFMVVIPLLVRDVHAGGAGELAIVNLCFWGGMLGSTMVQARLPPLRRPGRAILIGLAFGSAVFAAMALPMSFRLLAALDGAWGLGAGVVMTQARTIVQLAAHESHRARVLAIFQLGLVGAAPLGAVVLGYVAALLGIVHAIVWPAVAMLVVVASLLARSPLWGQRALGGLESAR